MFTSQEELYSMGLVMALNCCVAVYCGMKSKGSQLDSWVITGTQTLLAVVHTSGYFASDFLSKSLNLMQICIRQPMYFVDMYDSHSECISHICSSRWILELIKVNKTLLGIAQIIEMFCMNIKMAGWYLVCECYKLWLHLCWVFVMEQ